MRDAGQKFLSESAEDWHCFWRFLWSLANRFATTDFTSSCKEIDSEGAESHSHNAGEKTECCRSHEHGWNTLNYSISFILIVVE